MGHTGPLMGSLYLYLYLYLPELHKFSQLQIHNYSRKSTFIPLFRIYVFMSASSVKELVNKPISFEVSSEVHTVARGNLVVP